MMRILLVTNDFPPTTGGIQSYVRDFVHTLPAGDIVVYASTQDQHEAALYDATVSYPIIRDSARVLLPTPRVRRKMQQIIRTYSVDTVWFGAAAPLGLLAAAAKEAGATRVVATTHGHEVGWSMLPVARSLLGTIGKHSDCVTYISDYTLDRFASAFEQKGSCHFAHLPSGVDHDVFRPRPTQHSESLTVVCISRLVPRKGQDQLIQVWPEFLHAYPHAQLIIAGSGRDEKRLRRLAGDEPTITFSGRISETEKVELMQSADIFAMPCRTRGGGLDIEGLGIVYLEAQACQVPVIAGNSGGAPETMTADSGLVVHDSKELLRALCYLAEDAERRRAMGEAGRRNIEENWTWDTMGRRLRTVLGYAE
ncbi:glycosyltransferase family 4 protein [Corynebacterium sp. ES2794-CONJ1]|uniref:glycosyltransferase family 4 protein n=1 Tax=Corynebacterium sp. ES2794-CONJ1 TaxID=2980553 RepID=UPI0021DA4728|nr:glycosyltransferase family 4 protein [Corynebacterium sp. ES2794-CONJ1]MCU9518681.1 glycosyltransferase family 4 protein [Corynebacterium sp. ES2794-CONJ1]